ncbi:hypothetical protein BDV35DRAFT_352344 [Aspergillus flavus]|uniref:Uncharacterized protein n=1 Tax=Aspergillus flavus TaxID=5059 RepID=A0A5N6GZF2_ASPFL|nr:hypothetical protein BDV35DRAFT_352344 [Aspergillus flavus]
MPQNWVQYWLYMLFPVVLVTYFHSFVWGQRHAPPRSPRRLVFTIDAVAKTVNGRVIT